MEQRLRDALNDPEVQGGLEPETGFRRAMHELGAMSGYVDAAGGSAQDRRKAAEHAADLCLVIFKAVAALATTILGPRGLGEELDQQIAERVKFSDGDVFSGATISDLVRTMEGIGALLIRGADDPYSDPSEVLRGAAVTVGATFTRLSRAASPSQRELEF